MWENQWLDAGWTKLVIRLSYAGFDEFDAYTSAHFKNDQFVTVEVKGVTWDSNHNCQWLQVTALLEHPNDAFDLKMRFNGQ